MRGAMPGSFVRAYSCSLLSTANQGDLLHTYHLTVYKPAASDTESTAALARRSLLDQLRPRLCGVRVGLLRVAVCAAKGRGGLHACPRREVERVSEGAANTPSSPRLTLPTFLSELVSLFAAAATRLGLHEHARYLSRSSNIPQARVRPSANGKVLKLGRVSATSTTMARVGCANILGSYVAQGFGKYIG
jgi:hypothetical protein